MQEFYQNMAEVEGSCALGGYNEEFVDDIEDDLVCPICHLPLKVPVQTGVCGHRFCKLCLERHFMRQEADGQELTCPLDQNVLTRDKDMFLDKATERKVRSFFIKCPRGCQWTGELRSKEDHENECRRFPVNCPNGCGELVPREEILSHTEDNCALAPIPCPYAEIGCSKKVLQSEIESHLNSEMGNHLDLACKKLRNTEEELRNTKEQFKDFKETTKRLEERINALENKTFTYTWRIYDFDRFLWKGKRGNLNLRRIESCPFYINECGYKVKLQLYPNGCRGEDNHMSFYLIIMQGFFDSTLEWPFAKQVTITLIDQKLKSNERQNITKIIPGTWRKQDWNSRPCEECNRGKGFNEFVPHNALLLKRDYILNNTIVIEAKFETVP